jgi:hypothetical protein
VLIILALLLGPPLAAAFLSLFSPAGSYFTCLRILCVAVGSAVLVGIVAVRATTQGPTTDGLLHLRHAITLGEGAEVAVPFELHRTNGYGYEVELHLDPTLPTERWPPLEHLVSALDGPPLTDLLVDWAISRDGQELARREEPARPRRGLGWTTDGPLVDLGRFQSTDRGEYVIRIRIEQVPPALRGERADLVIDSDMIAYKDAIVGASVRNMAHSLLGLSAAVTLLLGLLALWMRPRDVTATG